MNIPEFTISCKCLFCSAVLETPEDVEYQPGHLIKCTKCGEENDYDSIVEVAKKEGVHKVKKTIENEFQKKLEKMFK